MSVTYNQKNPLDVALGRDQIDSSLKRVASSIPGVSEVVGAVENLLPPVEYHGGSRPDVRVAQNGCYGPSNGGSSTVPSSISRSAPLNCNSGYSGYSSPTRYTTGSFYGGSSVHGSGGYSNRGGGSTVPSSISRSSGLNTRGGGYGHGGNGTASVVLDSTSAALGVLGNILGSEAFHDDTRQFTDADFNPQGARIAADLARNQAEQQIIQNEFSYSQGAAQSTSGVVGLSESNYSLIHPKGPDSKVKTGSFPPSGPESRDQLFQTWKATNETVDNAKRIAGNAIPQALVDEAEKIKVPDNCTAADYSLYLKRYQVFASSYESWAKNYTGSTNEPSVGMDTARILADLKQQEAVIRADLNQNGLYKDAIVDSSERQRTIDRILGIQYGVDEAGRIVGTY